MFEKRAKKTGGTASGQPERPAPPRSKMRVRPPESPRPPRPFRAPRPRLPAAPATARTPQPRGRPLALAVRRGPPADQSHPAACARLPRAASLSHPAQHLLVCRKTLSSRNAPQSLGVCLQLWLDLHRLHPLLIRTRPSFPGPRPSLPPRPAPSRPPPPPFFTSQPKIT